MNSAAVADPGGGTGVRVGRGVALRKGIGVSVSMDYGQNTTLARIVRDVPFGGEGALQYVLDDQACDLAARDIDGGAIAAGTDVVIDRVEQGVAFVELWVRVEQRL